jgi:hypothetical protein
MTSQPQSPNRLTLVLIIALVVAAVVIGALVMALIMAGRQPTPSAATAPTVTVVETKVQKSTEVPLKAQRPTEAPPKAQNPLEGKWEVASRSGREVNYNVLPASIGNQIEFLPGSNVRAGGEVMQYSFIDSSHLKVVQGDGDASIFEYTRSGSTISLKDGTFSFVLEPFVALNVTQANLAGAWEVGDDDGVYVYPDCLRIPMWNTTTFPTIILFRTDNTMVLFRSGASGQSADGQFIGGYRIDGNTLIMAGDGFSTACNVRLLTKQRLDLVHRDVRDSGYNRYKRINMSVVPPVRPTVTPTPTPKAIVREVIPNSGAAQAGIEAGDQIVKLDDLTINTFDQVADSLREHLPGDVVNVTLVRAGHQLVLKVQLGTHPDDSRRAILGVRW